MYILTHQVIIDQGGLSIDVEKNSHIIGIVSGIEAGYCDGGVLHTVPEVSGV